MSHHTWFRFAEEMLERYRHDERIMAVAGQHFGPESVNHYYSYFFLTRTFMWGWATWRRAWAKYDIEMKRWPELRITNWLSSIGYGSKLFQRSWTRTFDSVLLEEIDTWDYQWIFACWINNGLCIYPAKTLVSNIGFGEDATHTLGLPPHGLECLQLQAMQFPLLHPKHFAINLATEKWIDKYVSGIDILRELKVIVRRSLAALSR